MLPSEKWLEVKRPCWIWTHVFHFPGHGSFYYTTRFPGRQKRLKVIRDGSLGKEQVSGVTGKKMDKRNKKNTHFVVFPFLNEASMPT